MGACGAVGIGTGTWAVLSSIPVGACACGAEGPMASIGPLALGAKGCVERLYRFAQGAADWRSGPRWSILSVLCPVHPFATTWHFPSRGNESVMGLAFCVIWHDKHSGDWLTAFATPYPAVPDFSTGKRVTRFSGRFASLRIVFPCQPPKGGTPEWYVKSMLSKV